MQKLVCEMCGSQDLQKQSGLYVCGHCGTKYSPEEAKKLFVEVNVKVDETDHIQKLYQLARQARETNNHENAAKYYEQILPHCPDDWEAMFFSVYYRSACCVIRDIAPSCDKITNILPDVFRQIHRLPASKQKGVVCTVANACTNMAKSMFEVALKHHMSSDPSIMSKYEFELKQRLVSASWIAVKCAICIMSFYEKNSEIAQYVQIPAKMAMEYQNRQTFVSIVFEPDMSNKLLGYIGRFDPDYVTAYREKQNGTVRRHGIICLVLGAICSVFGLGASGFLKWFLLPCGVIFLLYGGFQLVVLNMNNKLNGYSTTSSAMDSAPQATPTQQSVPAGGWTCTCGRVNASYVSSCSCGTNKRDIQ